MQMLLHNWKPYQTEITNKVAREYTHQQLEKTKAALQKGADMKDVWSYVLDMEGNVSRLEEKMGESLKRMEDMLTSLMTTHEMTPNSLVAFATPTGCARINSGTLVIVSHGNMASVSAPAAYVESGVPETEPVAAEYAENEGCHSQRYGRVADGQVEEFLQGFLHKQDVVLGYLEGMKSPNIIVLSGHSHGGPNIVMDLVASDIGDIVVPSTKHGRGTSNLQLPEVNLSSLLKNHDQINKKSTNFCCLG